MKTALFFVLLAFPAFLPAQCQPEILEERKQTFGADILEPDTFCSTFIFRSAKTKKWGAGYDDAVFLNPEYDSIRNLDETGYYFSWKGGKTFFWFIENSGTPLCTGDDMRFYYDGSIHLRVKKNGKWGQYNVDTREWVVPFVYDTPDFPGLSPSLADQQEILAYDFKKLHADRVVVDTLNQEGDFIARNAKTKKWGMYLTPDKKDVMVPATYDSIIITAEPFVIVKNKGKYGVYLGPFEKGIRKESVPCMYDDFRVIKKEGAVVFLLVKKNGKWGAVDWYDGKEILNFKYDRAEDVPLDEIPESGYYRQ